GGSDAFNVDDYGAFGADGVSSQRFLLGGNGRKFTWIEGTFSGAGTPASAGALLAANMSFGGVRASRFLSGALQGHLSGHPPSSNYAMTFRDVEFSGGLWLTVNVQSRYDRLNVHDAVAWVIRDTGSVFSRVRSAHNVAPAGEEGGTGIGVEGTGNAFVDCL